MTRRQERRAQELVAEIDGNVRMLHMGGFYESFMQAQRRTWTRIGKAAEPVRVRVNELLRERSKAEKARQSSKR